MICKSCASAADLASGRDGTPIEAGRGETNANAMVARGHARCTGCDCGHRASPVRSNLPAEVTPESMAEFREMIR